eukprot:COSAG04_NODE_10114_length_803_cov_1.338068_1_plen_33_part_10
MVGALVGFRAWGFLGMGWRSHLSGNMAIWTTEW